MFYLISAAEESKWCFGWSMMHAIKRFFKYKNNGSVGFIFTARSLFQKEDRYFNSIAVLGKLGLLMEEPDED